MECGKIVVKFENVYFINGTAYAGKSTMVKLLAEKYDGIACEENYQDRLLENLDTKEFPNLTYTRDLQDWGEFVRRTPDEYEAYSKGIYVKFKPEEVEILHDRMKEAGVQNMSAYIRKMAINGYVIIPEWPDLNRVISLHTRISNNLNQYAKKANETGKLYEEDIAEIKMMNNEQTELLKKALEAVIHLYEEDSKKRK